MSRKKYVVDKKSNDVSYKEKEDLKGFSVKPRNKVKIVDMIDVEKMTVINDNLIKKLVDKKVVRSLDKIFRMYNLIIEEDEGDDSSCDLLLGEIERFRELLLSKYEEHMKKIELKKVLTKLEIIEKEIKNKKSLILQDELVNKKGKGR